MATARRVFQGTDGRVWSSELAAAETSYNASSSNTIFFPRRLSRQGAGVAEARGINMRRLVHDALKAEIEAAIKDGEVGGPLYEGPIGESGLDRREGRHPRPLRPASGSTARAGRTLTYSRRFWQQAKGLAAARNLYKRQLVQDVLRKEIVRAVDAKEVRGDLYRRMATP